MPPDLALSSTLIGSNYPCLELIFMVPKVFEPLKFDCILLQHTPLRLTGIYIKKILPNSPAATNGCLQVGDRILAVNGNSVIGANYQRFVNIGEKFEVLDIS